MVKWSKKYTTKLYYGDENSFQRKQRKEREKKDAEKLKKERAAFERARKKRKSK